MKRLSQPTIARVATPLWQMPLALLLCWLTIFVQAQPSATTKARDRGFSQLESLGALAAIDRAAPTKRGEDTSAGEDDDPAAIFGSGLPVAQIHLDAAVALTELDQQVLSGTTSYSPHTPRAPPR